MWQTLAMVTGDGARFVLQAMVCPPLAWSTGLGIRLHDFLAVRPLGNYLRASVVGIKILCTALGC